jgi:hypothetical protein
MKPIGDAIQAFFKSADGHWLSYVTALSIIGGVTMALLQTIKDLFPVREKFQKYRLRKWMEEGAEEAREKFDNPNVSAAAALTDLVTLAVDGDDNAFYDLQIEQLCGQFTAALQIVLEFPPSHVHLLAVTASKASSLDLNMILRPPPVPPTPEFLDARNRVTHQCQRAIDAFQISAGFRWKFYMQLTSLFLSIALTWIALDNKAIPWIDGKPNNTFTILFTAVVSGFLAPVAKDLLAVLQKARGQ